MKTKLTILALCLFVISFFLPAYDVFDGGDCAALCAVELFADDLGNDAYYFPFTFSNLLMVVLPILLLTKYRRVTVPKPIIVIQIILLIHVVSWLFEGGIKDIQIGYYVWLLSMVLILYVTIRSRKSDPYSLQKKGNGKFSHLLTRP